MFTKLDEDSVNGCKDLHLMQNNWVLVESAEAYSRLYHELQTKLNELRASKGDTEEEEEKFKELEAELIENIELYKGLALKRFHAVIKIFKIFYNDQYDFHSYCMRRGTPRDYIDTLKWEDNIHSTPIYLRVLKGLSKIYFEINAEQLANKLESENDEKSNARAKKNKKQKKVQAQANKKRADFIAKVESEKEDADPLGSKLLP